LGIVEVPDLGHIDEEEDEEKKMTDIMRKIMVAYYMGQSLTAEEIARKLNICERTIYRDKKKMVEEWGLSEIRWAKVPPRWREEGTDETV
jgi:DNA-binding NarL/FixJ family response regulator